MKKIFLIKLFSLLFLISTSNCQSQSLIDYFKSFLQKNVSNNALLLFFELMRKNFSKKNYPGNLDHNKQAFETHKSVIKSNNGYIEDQHNYKDMKYGYKTIAYSGCEIIAVYNSLYYLTKDENIDFPQMIDYFEHDGILIDGEFGTTPRALEEYINSKGYRTQSSYDIKDYDKIGDKCDVFIITFYNNKEDIMDMIHTVALTKEGKKFHIHNNGRNSHQIGYNSITELLEKINNGKAKDIFLIGINKN